MGTRSNFRLAKTSNSFYSPRNTDFIKNKNAFKKIQKIAKENSKRFNRNTKPPYTLENKNGGNSSSRGSIKTNTDNMENQKEEDNEEETENIFLNKNNNFLKNIDKGIPTLTSLKPKEAPKIVKEPWRNFVLEDRYNITIKAMKKAKKDEKNIEENQKS